MLNKYLLDTADIEKLNNFENNINSEKLCVINKNYEFLGITTNPNAFYNAGINIGNIKEKIQKLQKFICDRRKDFNGEIHIEIPTTLMPISSINNFIDYIIENSDIKLTKIIFKIPPHPYILSAITFRDGYFNVTGVTNPLTALRCLKQKKVKYISFLLGRMESSGIPKNIIENIIHYIKWNVSGDQNIIMGSIRDTNHIKDSLNWGCIPTFDTKLFQFIDENYIPQLSNYHLIEKNMTDVMSYSYKMWEVHQQFFEEMNEKSVKNPIW